MLKWRSRRGVVGFVVVVQVLRCWCRNSSQIGHKVVHLELKVFDEGSYAECDEEGSARTIIVAM